MRDYCFASANNDARPLWFRVERHTGESLEVVTIDFITSDRYACEIARSLNITNCPLT